MIAISSILNIVRTPWSLVKPSENLLRPPEAPVRPPELPWVYLKLPWSAPEAPWNASKTPLNVSDSRGTPWDPLEHPRNAPEIFWFRGWLKISFKILNWNPPRKPPEKPLRRSGTSLEPPEIPWSLLWPNPKTPWITRRQILLIWNKTIHVDSVNW